MNDLEKDGNICYVTGCGRESASVKHCLCAAHLQRFYRTGSVGGASISKKRQRESFKEMNDGKDG